MERQTNSNQSVHLSGDIKRAVLSLTAAALFNKEINIPADTDWAAVFSEISKQGLVSLTYPVVQDLNIPADTLKRWSDARDLYLMNNMKNVNAHFELHTILSEAGIHYAILKGVASGSCYPDLLTRAYGDVDFVVAKDSFDKASEVLSSKGFTFNRQSPNHIEYYKGGIEYELHPRATKLIHNDRDPIIQEYFKDITFEAIPFEYNGKSCMIPCPRHQALSLLLHTVGHMSGTGVGLRHICDWAVFAAKMSDEFFETEMQPILKQTGLWTFTKILTALCTEHLGLRKFCFADIDDTAYFDIFIDDIFSSGNFGTKKHRDSHPKRNYSMYSSRGHKKSRLLFLFKVFNTSAYYAFPVIEKRPYLKPAAWIYVGVRHAVRMLLGKRTMTYTKNLLTEDPAAKELFEKWRLFEPEEDSRP